MVLRPRVVDNGGRMKKVLKRVVVGGIVLFALIQLVPYGRAHENPAVRQEPPWDSPATRALAERACFECHSNQTEWPWYSWVAPVSWLVQHDVDEGREHLNFSEWDREQKNADEAAEMIEEGEMPPWYFLPAHPEAKLTAEEKAQLTRSFSAMFPEKGRKRRGRADED